MNHISFNEYVKTTLSRRKPEVAKKRIPINEKNNNKLNKIRATIRVVFSLKKQHETNNTRKQTLMRKYKEMS